MATQHFDVLIIGAGLSGIGAGYHLQSACPDKTFAILEGRENIGGTWDLFRYPGIRSDSDMYTLGYAFKPWTQGKSIADGPSILEYVKSTARENGLDSRIRFNHWVKRLGWSSTDARWTVETEHQPDGDNVTLTANFVLNCSGYYRYEAGYTPDFPGRDDFQGLVIHPQLWPENLDYSDKRVVVIGSGATAVTLVPAMTAKARHVTMLQRSPTYILSMPDVDVIAQTLNRFLPARFAYQATRWKNVSLSMLIYQLCRRRPKLARNIIRRQLRKQLGPDFDIDTHFNPTYDPWDQRLCLVPNGDLFKALRKGQASVVTDHIERFTETGIQLKSGKHLDADIIVTATGLDLVALGGADVVVDGKAVKLGETMTYKGMMLSDVPNLAMIIGYTNASWTLKADLASAYVCRLIHHMDDRGYDYCVPRVDQDIENEPFLDLHSGYVHRALGRLPKQGDRAPWKLYQNYALDLLNFRFGPVEDSAMNFGRAGSTSTEEGALGSASL